MSTTILNAIRAGQPATATDAIKTALSRKMQEALVRERRVVSEGLITEAVAVGDIVYNMVGHPMEVLKIEAGGFRFQVQPMTNGHLGLVRIGKPVYVGKSELRGLNEADAEGLEERSFGGMAKCEKCGDKHKTYADPGKCYKCGGKMVDEAVNEAMVLVAPAPGRDDKPKYVTADGKWTEDKAQAKRFTTGAEARRYAAQKKLLGAMPVNESVIVEAGTRVKLKCNECGKQFSASTNSDPECPKCGGVDYDVLSEERNRFKVGDFVGFKLPTPSGKDKNVIGTIRGLKNGKYDIKTTQDGYYQKSDKEITRARNDKGEWYDVISEGISASEKESTLKTIATLESQLEGASPARKVALEAQLRSLRLKAKTRVNETYHMPIKTVQRVFDENGNIGETEILCGISNLKVNGQGNVVSYLGEATADPKDPKLHFKLSHTLTEYDRKQRGKPGYNSYAIGHYFGALEEVEKDIKKGMSVRAALVGSFTGRLLDVLLKAVGEDKATREELR